MDTRPTDIISKNPIRAQGSCKQTVTAGSVHVLPSRQVAYSVVKTDLVLERAGLLGHNDEFKPFSTVRPRAVRTTERTSFFLGVFTINAPMLRVDNWTLALSTTWRGIYVETLISVCGQYPGNSAIFRVK